MKQAQIRVRDWMMKFGQETHNNNPTIPSLEVRKLRAKLILEEALETIEGLGFTPLYQYGVLTLEESEVNKPNLVEIADGIADSLVVQLGTAVACGIDIEPVFEEVMRSNDSKLWTAMEVQDYEDKHAEYDLSFSLVQSTPAFNVRCYLVKDSTGKVIKSPSYSPANIQL